MTRDEYLYLENRWQVLAKQRNKLRKELEKTNKEMDKILTKIANADLTKAD